MSEIRIAQGKEEDGEVREMMKGIAGWLGLIADS
jgi:hypothetical protein